jgi:hypothetical protein
MVLSCQRMLEGLGFGVLLCSGRCGFSTTRSWAHGVLLHPRVLPTT